MYDIGFLENSSFASQFIGVRSPIFRLVIVSVHCVVGGRDKDAYLKSFVSLHVFVLSWQPNVSCILSYVKWLISWSSNYFKLHSWRLCMYLCVHTCWIRKDVISCYILCAHFIYHRGDGLTHTYRLLYTHIHLSSWQIAICHYLKQIW